MYQPRKNTPPGNAAPTRGEEKPRPEEAPARPGPAPRRFRPEAKDLYGYAHGYLRHKYGRQEEQEQGG